MTNKLTIDHQPLTINQGFTLIELLVVMAILGILATVLVGGFQSAQFRGRDAQRKSDLKQLSNALELFYNDYGFYPSGDSSGSILACPYSSDVSLACKWGSGIFTDSKTVYFKSMPQDPSIGQYFYRVVSGSGNKKFQIFAHLENPKDSGCIGGDCANPGINYYCGGKLKCNFAITSPNTNPTE